MDGREDAENMLRDADTQDLLGNPGVTPFARRVGTMNYPLFALGLGSSESLPFSVYVAAEPKRKMSQLKRDNGRLVLSLVVTC